jgi:hypothetical protein
MAEHMEPFAFKGFLLQDVKRLPGRFFARISGSLLCRPA